MAISVIFKILTMFVLQNNLNLFTILLLHIDYKVHTLHVTNVIASTLYDNNINNVHD